MYFVLGSLVGILLASYTSKLRIVNRKKTKTLRHRLQKFKHSVFQLAFRAAYAKAETALNRKRGEILRERYRVSYIEADESKCSYSLKIVIPFFNNFADTEPLLNQLRHELQDSGCQHWASAQVLVADDCSDFSESQAMSTFCSENNFEYHRNSRNLGFLRNSNEAFDLSSDFDFVLLLNSDVRLPKNFLARLSFHANSEKSVALVTIPSFEDMVGWGANSPSWRDLDDELAGNQGAFIAACTAVGYCLLIRTSACKSTLFDPAFGHGYGEDSDLHMRIVSEGMQSRLALDMVVFHAGGASYAQNPDAPSHRAQGSQLFRKKWWRIYEREFKFFLYNLQQYFASSIPQDLRRQAIWICSPAVGAKGIGGIRVFEDAANAISREGVPVRLFSLGGEEKVQFPGLQTVTIQDFEARFRAPQSAEDTKTDLFVFGGIEGARLFLKSARLIEASFKTVFLAQGPDFLMVPNQLQSFKLALERADVTAVVSDYMFDLASMLNARRLIRFSPLPKPSPASTGGIKTRTWDLSVLMRHEHGKASWLSAAVANFFALEKKWKVVAFGPNEDFLDPSVSYLGSIEQTQVLEIFRSTHVFFDSSLYEGFGLAPREALLSGAEVVAVSNGGNEKLRGQPGFQVVEQFNFSDIVRRIEEARDNPRLGDVQHSEDETLFEVLMNEWNS